MAEAPAAISWADWGAQVFDQARKTNKLVLIDVGIEGCTACRDMHVETYADRGVIARVAQHFVAVSVDADQQPDLGAKYEPWGWPATIFLDPKGRQVLAVAGYRGPKPFAAILDELAQENREGALKASEHPGRFSLETADLEERCRKMVQRLDEVADGHGWGGRTRPVEAAAVQYSFLRGHARGESNRTRLALRVTGGHSKLIDPEWGGVFVAATTPDWKGFIPEKRILHQADAIWTFAEAHHATGDARWVRAAHQVRKYVENWMRADDGTFYSTQEDAAPGLPATMTATQYYELPDAERRRFGIPPIDHAVYTDQNAQMISAYARLFEATSDPEALDVAVRAATAILERRLQPAGYVAQSSHDEAVAKDDRLRRRHTESAQRLFLLPQARFGRALLDLYRATGDAKYREHAVRVGEALATLEDRKDGGFYATTPRKTDAFVERTKPYLANLATARLYNLLAEVTKDENHRRRAERTLRFAGRRGVLEMFGPTNIATYALALDELLTGPVEMSVVGDSADPRARSLFDAAVSVYEPRKVLHYERPGRYPDRGEPSLYVCTRDRCSKPIVDPSEVRDIAGDLGTMRRGSPCTVRR